MGRRLDAFLFPSREVQGEVNGTLGMKFTLFLNLFSFLCIGSMVGHEPDEEVDVQKYFLTEYKGHTISTNCPGITIWTKENPFTTPDDEFIIANFTASPEWAKKDIEAVLVLTEPGGKDGDFFGDALLQAKEFTYENPKKTVKLFQFTLKAKYFRQAKIRAWADDVDEFELHLHKAPEKLKAGSPSKPKPEEK